MLENVRGFYLKAVALLDPANLIERISKFFPRNSRCKASRQDAAYVKMKVLRIVSCVRNRNSAQPDEFKRNQES